MSDENETIAAATLAGLFQQSSKSGMSATTTTAASAVQASAMQTVRNATHAAHTASRGKEDAKFPVEPRIIQIIKKPRTFVNHSYRDCSSVPAEAGDAIPADIAEMTFPQKVHHILSQEEYSKFICWQPHGRAFRISIPKMFETKVCSKYMGHTRYSSFLRQLSNHSFKLISQGPDRNCYYHEFMLRDMPHLCKFTPKPKDARRLIPDPANEPDFYAISEKYPVSGGVSGGATKSMSSMGADVMPQAGSPRRSSQVPLMTNAMPPAKRARTISPEGSSSGFQSMAQSLPSQRSATEALLARLVTPNTATGDRSVTNVNASSLLAATNSFLATAPTASAPAAFPAMPRSPVANSSSNQGCNSINSWAALYAPQQQQPQMQTAVDRNAAVLAALRAAMTSQAVSRPPPPPQPQANNQQSTAALAVSLLQQARNPSNGGANQLAALCQLLNGQY